MDFGKAVSLPINWSWPKLSGNCGHCREICMEIALAIKNLINGGKKKGAQRVVRGKFKRTAPRGGQFSLFRR